MDQQKKIAPIRNPWILPILCLIIVNLLIGAFTFRDYGESIDEAGLQEYAIQSLVAYKSWITHSSPPEYGSDIRRYYGTAFLMGIVFCVWLVGVPAYSVMAADLWHLAYFGAFQVAVLCIYLLARRWLSNWAAFTVAFLFSTQPLLWGHAFINPKDIPFMAFFLASIVSGLWMCDKVFAPSVKSLFSLLSWKKMIARSEKRQAGMSRPASTRSIHLPFKWKIQSFLRELFLSFMKPPVLIAGIILGLTTSVRVFGPLAGLIVVIYGLLTKEKKSLAPFFTYAIVAVVFMYLTWPYLWSAPFAHLKESITTMSAFPWMGRVLFNGNYYSADKLPGSYLPVLFSIQFTEPVVLLFAIGCGIALYDLVHRKISGLFGISLVWFFIPVSLLVLTRRPIYDNFRQILFLVPPIFLICGIALEAIFRIARKWSMRIAFMILLCIPGIYAGGYLHPYEYIYYNNFAGGIDGAFRKFETDYWMTSFREAAEYLNQNAERNARIVAWGAFQIVQQYTRPDLIVEPEYGDRFDLSGGFNYAVLSSRGGNDDLYPDEEQVFSIKRGSTILAVVKQLSPSSSPSGP